MRSLLRNNIITLYTFLALITCCSLLHADDIGKQNNLPTHDVYYPNYPPTTPATGEKQKLIQRGEYLAKAGDCIACHTDVQGGTPAFAGRLPIATPFGTFYSPNITPDKKTGIGNWTEEDFIRALKKGRDPKGRNYFPVFPYVYFSNITDDDARALFAYFMSIPPVELENKPLPFPFNVPGSRLSLWGWNLLFFYPNISDFKEDSKKSSEWNRGKYLVDGLGHCSMCHTPLNPFGAPKNRYYLTGGFINDVWAPNIGKYALQSHAIDEIADVFSKNELLNHAGPIAGPMAEVNHNSLSYLTREDHLAIATYLKTVVSEEPFGITPSNAKPSLKRGRDVYFGSCIVCHQEGKMTAPRIGNSDNWYMRAKENNLNELYRHAIEGYNSMPLMGACVTCSQNDVISAVDYMLHRSLTRSQWITLETKKKVVQKAPSGKNVYTQHCAACHDTGRMGAPKIGDKEAWRPLIAKNFDVLVENTLKGKQHPPKGGCKDCSTAEIVNALKYIIDQSSTEGNYNLW